MDTKQPQFNNLPDDVLFMFVRYLDLKSRGALSVVSKRLSELAEQPSFWRMPQVCLPGFCDNSTSELCWPAVEFTSL